MPSPPLRNHSYCFYHFLQILSPSLLCFFYCSPTNVCPPPIFGCVSGHDWAIVELEVPIAFSDRVQPICLPSSPSHQQISDGEVLTVTSWGRRDAFHKGDPLIREIPLRHDAECKGRPWSDTMPTNVEDYLCAKALNPKDYRSARTCHGDSGSGMEWKRARRENIGTALPQNAAQPFQPRIVPQPLQQTNEEHLSGGAANGSVTHRVEMPKTGKSVTQLMKQRPMPKIHARNVLRSPLVIPQLEMMKKWRNSRRNDETIEKGGLINQGDQLVKLLLNNIEQSGEDSQKWSLNEGERGAKTDRSEVINRRDRSEMSVRTELIGVTSYGSRQCGSDELARFTRVVHYVKKICALIGVCYQLDVNGQKK